MKTLTLFFASTLVLLGCATVAPISYQEQCARKGLVLSGVTSGSSSSTAYSWNDSNLITARGTSEHVACEVPKTEAQTCEAKRLANVSAPKFDYNSDVKLWNAGIGTGYVLWVLPGVGMKLWADSKYDKAMERSSQIEQETAQVCQPLPAPEIRTPAAK